MGFPGGSEVEASASNVGDLGSIPGSGRSPGGGAWWATVHGVSKSWTQLSDLNN